MQVDSSNWESYLKLNLDLIQAGINTMPQAIAHWKRHGCKENRQIYKDIISNTKITKVEDKNIRESFFNICYDLLKFIPTKFPIINKKSNKKSVIVETRNLKHLEFTIKNTIQKLGDGWGHMIFCSNDNVELIKSICDDISDDIEIIILNNITSINDYNNLFLDIDFWNKIDCEKVLIYQSDTIIFNKFDNVFLKFDYIGGSWGKNHRNAMKDILNIDISVVGNGGLSLRSVKIMIDILKNNSPMLGTYFNLDKIPEDLFFCQNIGKNKIADKKFADLFSIEFEINKLSFGCHQPYKFFTKKSELEYYIYNRFLKKTNKKRILFITHQESLTGAPKVLKHLINKMIKEKEYEIFVLSMKDVDDNWNPNFRLSDMDVNMDVNMKFVESVLKPDLVFANSTDSLMLLNYFKCKKILFVHEYKSLYNYCNLSLMKNINKILIATNKTKLILSQYNIDSVKIPYFLEYDTNFDIENQKPKWFLSIGHVQDRKGVDRFIDIAKRCPTENFIWVGPTYGIKIENNEINYIESNIFKDDYKLGEDIINVDRTIKIPKNVKFIGLRTEMEILEYWLPKAKALLMLSYDDPFPLVVIESKILNKNVVTLKESGDSYEICDDNDLILDKYSEIDIVNWIKNLTPNTVLKRTDIIKQLEDNYKNIIFEIKKCLK